MREVASGRIGRRQRVEHPKIGVAATIGLVITGNLIVAALIDRFGWFGVDQIPLEWTRVIGILLLAGGATLLLRK